jgi:flagellar basal-body rod protein FlgB
MGLTDIPLLSMLRTRLQWAQERQRVLAENVANADMPNYRARDLAPLKFEAPPATAAAPLTAVSLARTDSGHIAGIGQSNGPFRAQTEKKYDVSLTGNAVNLEQEMMKVAANQMEYQAVTALYARSLGLLKTAIGKGGAS